MLFYADMPPLEDIIVQVPDDNSIVNISWPSDHKHEDCTYVAFWCLSNIANMDCTVRSFVW